MQRYIWLDESGYLIGVGGAPFTPELKELVEVPDDLDFDRMNCYLYHDGGFFFDREKAERIDAEHADEERKQKALKRAEDMLQTLTRTVMVETAVKAAETADDVIVLAPLLPAWETRAYQAGDVVAYDGVPYRCCQAHDATENPAWTPTEARSLWAAYHATSADLALPYVPPTGAHDAYQAGEYAVYGGNVFRCIMDGIIHAPSTRPAAWEAVDEPHAGDDAPDNEPVEAILDWAQPLPGVTPAYDAGAVVRHNGKVWMSIVGNNVWEPGAYGWNAE